MQRDVPTLAGHLVEAGSVIEFMAVHVFESERFAVTIRPGARFTVEAVDVTDYSDPMWGDEREQAGDPARLLIRVLVDGVPKMIDVPCDAAVVRPALFHPVAQA